MIFFVSITDIYIFNGDFDTLKINKDFIKLILSQHVALEGNTYIWVVRITIPL